MSSIGKGAIIAVAALLLATTMAGCDASSFIDKVSSDGGAKSGASPSATAALAANHDPVLPSDVPKDIEILGKPKEVLTVKTGDGVTPGDGFYQLTFNVSTSLDQTAQDYRAYLTGNGYEFVDEPIAGSVSLSGATPTWKFFLTIAKSTEVAGQTSVTIAYTK
jgi:hypothetical protein